MLGDLWLSVPPTIDRKAVLDRLDSVLDPELDESILELGMVNSILVENAELTVELRLPTHWCAANFVYIMAFDTRRELLKIDGIDQVTVRVPDHFTSNAIEEGVNAGRNFADAFPDEATENLDQIRDLFLRKGFIKRQEEFLRQLIRTGITFEEISALRVEDARLGGDNLWVRRSKSQEDHIGSAREARRYSERRGDLKLDCSPSGPLMTDLSGNPIPADEMEDYFIRARTTRVSTEANGSFCAAVLQSRIAGKEETEARPFPNPGKGA